MYLAHVLGEEFVCEPISDGCGVWVCVMCVSTMQNAFPNVDFSLKIFKSLFPHFPFLFLYCEFL